MLKLVKRELSRDERPFLHVMRDNVACDACTNGSAFATIARSSCVFYRELHESNCVEGRHAERRVAT